MATVYVGPSPGDEASIGWRLDQINWFWRQLYAGQDSGETTWEELGVLRDQVNSLIADDPPDVTRAETFTAYAMWLLAGVSDS